MASSVESSPGTILHGKMIYQIKLREKPEKREKSPEKSEKSLEKSAENSIAVFSIQ